MTPEDFPDLDVPPELRGWFEGALRRAANERPPLPEAEAALEAFAWLDERIYAKLLAHYPNLAAIGFVEVPERPPIEQVGLALVWLAQHAATIRTGTSSYAIKHVVERWIRDTYSRDAIPNPYIGNGAVIAALLLAGYPLRRSEDGINAKTAVRESARRGAGQGAQGGWCPVPRRSRDDS